MELVNKLTLDEHKKFANKICEKTLCCDCPYRGENTMKHGIRQACFVFTEEEVENGQALKFMEEIRNELILNLYNLTKQKRSLVRKYYLNKE